jgi:hypothetical protein
MASRNPFKGLIDNLAQDDDVAEYAELGRFITAFAHAEAAVHMLARRASGMSDEKARVVFGGARLDELMKRVRAMMCVDKFDRATIKEVDACFDQLKVIAEGRNKLVHRSTHFEEKFMVTNALTSRSLAVEVDYFDRDELSAMYFDCLAIFLRLAKVAAPPAAAALDVTELFRRPWQYSPKARAKPKPKAKAKGRKTSR